MIHIFIINNFAGNKHLAKHLRQHLAQKEGFRYFVFNSIRPGFETDIARRIKTYYEDEQLRFYCCGGSGTMRNILNGFDNFDNVEVAFIPCGLSNDFLKCFGDCEALFRDIDNMIEGKPILVDYIKSNNGVMLNTFSVGLDSKIVSNMEKYRVYDVFGGQIPYIISLVISILFSKARYYEIKVDGKVLKGKYAEVIMGNGGVLGGNLHFAEKYDPTDGSASYFIIPGAAGITLLPTLANLMKKRFTKLKKKALLGECKTLEIRALDGKSMGVNHDGELIEECDSWSMEIVKQGLRFVMPKGFDN